MFIMYCKECGKEIAEDVKFCSWCGKPVSDGVPSADTSASVNSEPISGVYPTVPDQPAAKIKKPLWKKVWFWLIVIILLLIVLGSVGGNDSDKEKVSDTANTGISADAQTEPTDDAEITEKTEPAKKADYEVGEGTVRTRTDSIGTKWIAVAVPVKNTGNTALYLSSSSVDIENADGTLADTVSSVSVSPQVLQPGETAWYYEETFFEGDMSGEYKAVPHIKAKEASVDCIRYEVSEVQVRDTDYFGAGITGRVLNTTEEDGDMVYVWAQLFDADGNLLESAFTITDGTLAAGEKTGFSVSVDNTDIRASDIADTVIYAYPSQYQF